MPSPPGAEDGQDLLKASLISSSVSEGAEGSCARPPLRGRRSFDGKKWSGRAFLIDTRSLAPGREGNLEGFLRVTNRFPGPYVVRCCLAEKVCPGGVFSFLNGFEIPQSGLLESGEEVAGIEFSGLV